MASTQGSFCRMVAAGRLVSSGILVWVSAGCAGRSADAAPAAVDGGGPPPAPAWTVAGNPGLSIGRVDGDEAYLLHNAVSALRLENGTIAVLNAGTQQLKYYDAAGNHIRTVGGKGDGPGEFRWPAKLYLIAPDTIAVFDRATEMMSRYDPAGEFLGAAKAPAPEGEKFGRDAWLYRRNYVDGPMTPAERPPVRFVLDRLPPLPDGGSYRYVKVDDLGRLWVYVAPADAGVPTEWQVYGPDGSILGRVSMPAGFELMQATRTFLLGRSHDGLNVEHIDLYALDPGTAGPAGMLPEAAPPAPPAAVAAPADEALKQMRSILRNGMAAQEIYYSKPEHGYRYASRADELTWPEDLPAGFNVDILDAGQYGWTMLVTFASEPVLCGAMVGLSGPIGWTPGVVACSD